MQFYARRGLRADGGRDLSRQKDADRCADRLCHGRNGDGAGIRAPEFLYRLSRLCHALFSHGWNHWYVSGDSPRGGQPDQVPCDFQSAVYIRQGAVGRSALLPDLQAPFPHSAQIIDT